VKGTKTKIHSERAEKYREFFQPLLDELRGKYHFSNAKVAQPQNWYSFSSGFPDFIYSASVARTKKIPHNETCNRWAGRKAKREQYHKHNATFSQVAHTAPFLHLNSDLLTRKLPLKQGT
jgi:hypothetical protein